MFNYEFDKLPSWGRGKQDSLTPCHFTLLSRAFFAQVGFHFELRTASLGHFFLYQFGFP